MKRVKDQAHNVFKQSLALSRTRKGCNFLTFHTISPNRKSVALSQNIPIRDVGLCFSWLQLSYCGKSGPKMKVHTLNGKLILRDYKSLIQWGAKEWTMDHFLLPF
jgi:hypothetical protein